MTKDIFVKIGGFYGFCKITFAEVMAQIPNEIVSEVVAFALDPKKSPQILNYDYQSASIVFYGRSEEELKSDDSLPSVEGLIKPLDLDKAERLKDKVRPIIGWARDGCTFIDPGKIDEPFMSFGVWLRIGGSNLHKHNAKMPISVPYELGKSISIYQAFDDDGSDFFQPNYAYTISQIPDELITENTIGFVFKGVDYFRTKEGTVHEVKYTLVEKVNK